MYMYIYIYIYIDDETFYEFSGLLHQKMIRYIFYHKNNSLDH